MKSLGHRPVLLIGLFGIFSTLTALTPTVSADQLVSDAPAGVAATDPVLRVQEDGSWAVWWTDARDGVEERYFSLSVDEGESWSSATRTTVFAEMDNFDIEFVQGAYDFGVVYGSGGDVLIAAKASVNPGFLRYVASRSSDFGASWDISNATIQDFPQRPGGPQPNPLYVSSVGPDSYNILDWTPGTSHPYISQFSSSDGGQTWQPGGLSGPPGFEEIRGAKLFLSHTGQAVVGCSLHALSKFSYFGAGATLSLDAGASWSSMFVFEAPHLETPSYEILSPRYLHPNLAYTSWTRDGLFEWSQSTDQGATWSEVGDNSTLPPVDGDGRPHLYDLDAIDNLWGERTMNFVDAEGTVFERTDPTTHAWRFSRDFGATWTPGSTPYVDSPGPDLTEMTGTPLNDGRVAVVWRDSRSGTPAVYINTVSTAPFEVVFGESWDHISLQDVLDAEYGVGVIDAAHDYEGARAGDADPPYWEDLGLDGVLIREIAGYKAKNILGWYAETFAMPMIDGVDDGVVFSGPMQEGASVAVTFPAGMTTFGFYLNPNGTDDAHNAPEPEMFFTNRAYNDEGPDGGGLLHGPPSGDPQCLIYNLTALKGMPTFVLAWEDLDYGGEITPSYSPTGTDDDFQDLVVEVTAVTPVSAAVLSLEAHAESKGVRLSWDLSQALGIEDMWLQRSVDGSLARTIARWSGEEMAERGAWFDEAVTAGHRYRYQLVAEGPRGALASHHVEMSWSAPTVSGTQLLRCVPNPFNPRTQILYGLDAPSSVEVKIYDVAGRAVWSVDLGPRGIGEGAVVWNGCDTAGEPVASGVYRVRLITARGTDELAVTLLR